MKGLSKWIILGIFLAVCIQGVSAMSVGSITVDPQGSIAPGTPVTASFSVDVTGFPQNDDLQIYTDLDKPVWTYTVVNAGVETPQPSETFKTLTVIGFVISYLKTPVPEVTVKVSLEGTAPTVDGVANKTILRVSELDTNGRPITSTQVERLVTIVNPSVILQLISQKDADLQALRSSIDEKAAIGIDTSAAEAKYNEAQQYLNSAKARSTAQFVLASNDLTAAGNSIADGQKELDRAWSENEVAAAQVPIDNVDVVIGWFKGNESTANDQELPAIITKREVALSYISDANDQIATGNYELARSKAQEAYAKGNESYNDALARQAKISGSIIGQIFDAIGGVIGSVGVIVGVIVVVVLVVVGVVIYRKRSRWDELG